MYFKVLPADYEPADWEKGVLQNYYTAFKGVAVTQGGRCQEAKFYDVNSVSKRSCCRKSCKFASFLGSQQFSWEKKGNHYDVTKR